MKPKWSLPVLTRACLAALAAALILACSGGSSEAPTPPTPPPFQPQTVVVQLGTKGGATTLISTQAGGWTRNGQPLTSGSTVTGENAASYRLTLTNGTWTAAFIPADPEALVLGTSGDAVLLQVQEDGSYQLDGEPLATGKLVEADNGNRYRLVQGADGAWMAEFAPPQPQIVHLGTSGESRQVGRLEDGGYSVDGEALTAGTLITTRNGNRYALTLGTDGIWAAAYLEPDPQRLQLGTSGDAPLLVYRLENGTFRLDDDPLWGGRVVEASNGNSYRLTLGPDGMWQASFIPSPVTVQLGSSGGAVSLTPNEDGTWLRGSTAFSSGDKVTGSNGFEYLLTLGADGWIVEALPMTIEVPVSGSDAQPIALARLEDGTYLYDGSPVRSGDTVNVGGTSYTLQFADNRWTAQFLQGEVFVALGTAGDSLTLIKMADGTYEYNGRRVRNGSVERSPNTGIRYRLRLSPSGVWSASVYVPPTVDPGVDPGGGTPPVAAENILDALPDELVTDTGAFDTKADPIQPGVGTTNANGNEIDYSRYYGSGSYEDDTFVQSVIRAIDRILGPIQQDNLLHGNDSQRFVAGVLIDSYWDDVEPELDLIFGQGRIPFPSDPPQRAGETDVDEAVDRLEELREDLSDIANFKSEFKTQIDAATGVSGDDIFNARRRVLALGASTNTRFGVISTLASGTTAQAAAGGTGTYTPTAFAFSPLEATPTGNLPSRGTARYAGSTWAIAGDQVLYSGSIELLASIGIERVTAKVSNLRRSDNNASWVHENKEVREIDLPEINSGDFGKDDEGSFSVDSATAKVVFEELDGLFSDSVGDSALDGQFVGIGTSQTSGTAVMGTWNVGALLDGSFGAERITTTSAILPSQSSSVNPDSIVISGSHKISITPADNEVTIPDFNDPFELSSLRSSTRTDSTTSAKTATIRLGSTSLTHFGVWTLEDRTDEAKPTTTGGIFAYSSLAPTDYSANPDYYPLRVIASYAGRTVAVDDNYEIYEGSYALNVDWDEDGGTILASISGLQNGSTRFAIDGQTVSQIGFQHSRSGKSTNFSGPRETTVRYANGTDGTLSGATHKGQFLGNLGPDGPYAVVGEWSLQESGISGAFGATLVGAP